MDFITTCDSPIGRLILASDGQALTGLWMEGQKYFPVLENARMREDVPVFLAARSWLDAYFAGEQPPITFPLNPQGSPFRQRVWQILQTIPYGQTATYGAIAKQLAAQSGTRVSPQAVGGAVGHNPISILIPCHRVVGTDGSLTGYAGGIGRKEFLLSLENKCK